VLPSQLTVDMTFVHRFLREARLAAKLQHPNIVTIYDVGEVNGTYYIVMEFVEGRPLNLILQEEGPLSPERAARITIQVAQALDYAHKQGVLHRDVKPGNILVGEGDWVKLTDFGIAWAAGATRLTKTGMVVGTPEYMSPEQAQGREINGRSDLYSLGVVLYEMLTGRVPFQGDTPLAVLHQHAFTTPPPPRQFNPNLSPRLEKVLLKALAKEPEKRFPTGLQLSKALVKAIGKRREELLPMPSIAREKAAAPRVKEVAQEVAQTTGRYALRLGKGVFALTKGLTWALLRFLILLLLVCSLVATGLVVGATYLLGRWVQYTVVGYNWDWTSARVNETVVISEEELTSQIRQGIEPYTLDLIQDLTLDLKPQGHIIIQAKVKGTDLEIEGRLFARDGAPQVIIEKLNDFPLYVVGGMLSRNINQGLKRAFDEAPVYLEELHLTERELSYRLRPIPRRFPTPTPSPTFTPTKPPKAVIKVINELEYPITLLMARNKWNISSGEEVEITLSPGPYSYTIYADEEIVDTGTITWEPGTTKWRIKPN